jgi:hypothetical protein
MTDYRWALSILIVFHLVALLLASLPDPDELNPVQPRASMDNHGITPVVTSALDRSAAWLRSIEPALVNATKPLRALTEPYISVGLRQKWNMFANPMTVDQYVRVDEYVESLAAPLSIRVFRELALPAQREDRVRLVHKFRDKAVLNALEAFSVARARGEKSEPLPGDLQPLSKYFRNRFQHEFLDGEERVVRTDVWFGQVAIPPPGQRLTTEQRRSRVAALAAYWDGPAEAVRVPIAPRPGALQREDAIVWRLEYVEEP